MYSVDRPYMYPHRYLSIDSIEGSASTRALKFATAGSLLTGISGEFKRQKAKFKKGRRMRGWRSLFQLPDHTEVEADIAERGLGGVARVHHHQVALRCGV